MSHTSCRIKSIWQTDRQADRRQHELEAGRIVQVVEELPANGILHNDSEMSWRQESLRCARQPQIRSAMGPIEMIEHDRLANSDGEMHRCIGIRNVCCERDNFEYEQRETPFETIEQRLINSNGKVHQR